MGELYDICEQEYNRLRPKFEEFAGVSLSHVLLMEADEYLTRLEAKGQPSTEARWDLSTTPSMYAEKQDYGADVDAIVVNESRMRQGGLNPGHVMAHELGHVTHSTVDNPASHWIEDDEVWMAFIEGAAVYLQTDCIPDLGDDLRRYTDRMRDALLRAHETRRLNKVVRGFSDPWCKIDGYAFFRRAAERAGPDIIFDILANPPQTMEEIGDPERYLKRVMPDG